MCNHIRKIFIRPLSTEAVFFRYYSDEKAASQGLKDLSAQISKGGFPKGSIVDLANVNRMLVPIGNNGMDKLKTTLIAR